jgi:DNA polymerase-3 subunit gamma/tau
MADALARFASFDDVVDLIARMRDMTLLLEVESNLRLVNYRPGRIEFEPTPQASRDLAATLSARLQGWTGARWGVSVVSEGGAPTIAEVKAEEMAKAEAEAMKNPLVAEIFARFPGAKIEILPEEDTAAIEAEALAEVEDEWDPFEEG